MSKIYLYKTTYVSKPEFLAAAYNAAILIDPNYAHYIMTKSEALFLLCQKMWRGHPQYFGILKGKPIFLNLDEECVDVAAYNRFNGRRLAQKVLLLLQQSHQPESDEIRTARDYNPFT